MTISAEQSVKIPEGLTPVAKEKFKAVRMAPSFKGKLIKSKEDQNQDEVSGLECASTKVNVKQRSPVKDIREFCIQCVGGSVNGKKPLKTVRECQNVNCMLHPYRMGKNPYRKLDLSEKDRKIRSETGQKRVLCLAEPS